MKHLIFLFLIMSACSTKQVKPEADPVPSANPIPSVTPSATTVAGEVTQDLLVTYDQSSGIEKSFAQPGIDLLNKVYANGCLKEKFLSHSFESLKNIEGEQVKTRAEAYERYISGRPYALNLRWYSVRGSVIGYTFNWLDGYEVINGKDCYAKAGNCPSETRIYSNSRIVSYYEPKDLAAHWAHELSHQARSGGFVHWSFHQGSVPYEVGDIVDDCLSSN